MRTYIYIDGFNFYYGAVKGTPFKWLNFKELFKKLLAPHHKILRIKYFTAIVSGKFDPDQPQRQKTFLRALQTQIPEIEIFYGSFLTHEVLAPLACTSMKFPYNFKVPVYKTEEKGSDVNLAVHLVNDAWENQYDCAVVVSNDSDLAEALRIVKSRGKMVGLINPRDRTPARELMKYADFNKKVRTEILKSSQFPDTIPGTTIRKPSNWYRRD
jgi:uncharacterized LabA/DUF88 family protein